jgi:site-specific DNA recombinase
MNPSHLGLAQVIDELDQAGVIFRSATEPFDTGTPAGRSA